MILVVDANEETPLASISQDSLICTENIGSNCSGKNAHTINTSNDNNRTRTRNIVLVLSTIAMTTLMFLVFITTSTSRVTPFMLSATSSTTTSWYGSEYRSLCGDFSHVAFADMHDGDIKVVTVEDDTMIIHPTQQGEHWTVKAEVDTDTCTAWVNFKVPGKPNPPPRTLMVTIWNMEKLHSGDSKLVFEFTDPSGTLAPSGTPLNHWVQLS